MGAKEATHSSPVAECGWALLLSVRQPQKPESSREGAIDSRVPRIITLHWSATAHPALSRLGLRWARRRFYQIAQSLRLFRVAANQAQVWSQLAWKKARCLVSPRAVLPNRLMNAREKRLPDLTPKGHTTDLLSELTHPLAGLFGLTTGEEFPKGQRWSPVFSVTKSPRGGRGHPHFLGTRKWVAPSAPG